MDENDGIPSENTDNATNGPSNNNDFNIDEPSQSLELDLGDDFKGKWELRRSSVSNSSDLPRREENPFSFKHFLRSDSSSYKNKGARPKVYYEGRPLASTSSMRTSEDSEVKHNRITPEFSSALPDFVQDHLIVEQCYLGNQMSAFNIDVDNLPDFAPNRTPSGNIRNNNDISNIRHHVNNSVNSSDCSVPLDLPFRQQAEFPLDLPVNSNTHQNDSRNGPLLGEVGASKSLPDFLTDGAVHGQIPTEPPPVSSPDREVDRLRRELSETQRQLAEQTERGEILRRQLEAARSKEQEYTQNLIKALEQVEENLERSNKKANSAEFTIFRLKQEIKSLKIQLDQLQMENQQLRNDEGAVGGVNYCNTNHEIHSQRLARDLRSAANTAEQSLRQLMSGVDNLRMMASTLESMQRIEERTEPFLDIDDDIGPAL